MSSSWSNVPLDLLISIRKKLENVDLLSFRSVCSQWHYASPIPNPCPTYYIASSDKKKNIFKVYLKNSFIHKHFISLPFSFPSHCFYFGNSNGWLVFEDNHNEIIYLFDPISSRKFILPRLNKKLVAYYEKVKPIVHNANYAYFNKVVVTSSIVRGIAAAGIVSIGDRGNLESFTGRFIFYRQGYGDCQRWSLLMEGSKGIIDICLAGDGRFYALGDDCELYMLDERPPLMKLKKIKLWLPKHILEHSSGNTTRRLHIKGYGMKKSGENNLKIYGYCEISDTSRDEYISLKVNVAKLNGYSNNIEAACDAKWRYEKVNMAKLNGYRNIIEATFDAKWRFFQKLLPSKYDFIPLFNKEHHSIQS